MFFATWVRRSSEEENIEANGAAVLRQGGVAAFPTETVYGPAISAQVSISKNRS